MPKDTIKANLEKEYCSEKYGKFKILKYHSSTNIEIKFIETGFVTKTSASRISDGKIKDKLHPVIYGVGFIGEGKHLSSNKGKPTESYRAWKAMLCRCYCKKYKSKNRSYEECAVSESWLNYQNFADWFDNNHKKGWELDKDILFHGNKLYSDKTCIYVPQNINKIILGNRRSKNGLATDRDWETYIQVLSE